jgi:hypothetical protein
MSTVEFIGSPVEPAEEGEPPSVSPRLRSWENPDCDQIDFEYEALVNWYLSRQDEEARCIDDIVERQQYTDRMKALYDYDNPPKEISSWRRLIASLFKSSIS